MVCAGCDEIAIGQKVSVPYTACTQAELVSLRRKPFLLFLLAAATHLHVHDQDLWGEGSFPTASAQLISCRGRFIPRQQFFH